MLGAPTVIISTGTTEKKKNEAKKKKKRYTVSKAQRITAISTTEKITYNSLHYNKKHKKFS